MEILPTDVNLNLALWYRGQVSAQCKLYTCGFLSQTLQQVLNKCDEALCQHRFRKRHDSVLSLNNTFITTNISICMTTTSSQTCLVHPTPFHLTLLPPVSNLTILYNIASGMVVSAYCTFEENFTDAERRKMNHYEDLLQLYTKNGYKAQLMTIQVGSRGVLNAPSLSRLQQLCKPSGKEWNAFMASLWLQSSNLFYLVQQELITVSSIMCPQLCSQALTMYFLISSVCSDMNIIHFSNSSKYAVISCFFVSSELVE